MLHPTGLLPSGQLLQCYVLTRKVCCQSMYAMEQKHFEHVSRRPNLRAYQPSCNPHGDLRLTSLGDIS